ncbi:MAG TPA: TylF/MycF/NovP-related O-methyltransferase [Kofleriaceae bacterium]|nr:TylF/MycF/NovP-related O-methyltransferase [Kofleriaceae bacterium]
MRGPAARPLRRGPGSLYRRLKSLEYLATRDRGAVARFVVGGGARGLAGRIDLVRRFVAITNHTRGYHTLGEMLCVAEEILRRARPVVLEAGCGHGSSTAKLSLAARASGGQLAVFDSFRGLPANRERHTHLDGRTIAFRAGAFRATLPSVQRTVARFGAPERCTFHKGWFADTLPALEPRPHLDVVVLDVDLLDSTRVCLRELYPRLRPGGVLFTLDGQLRATHELLADDMFWRDEVGVASPPTMRGLGRAKLVTILGPAPLAG